MHGIILAVALLGQCCKGDCCKCEVIRTPRATETLPAPRSIMQRNAVQILPRRALAVVKGKVVNVHDGDTVSITINVRLAEIDAPELKQEFGEAARDRLSLFLRAGKPVELYIGAIDGYGRAVAYLVKPADKATPEDVEVNRNMIALGYAWRYDQYSFDHTLEPLESESAYKRVGAVARCCTRSAVAVSKTDEKMNNVFSCCVGVNDYPGTSMDLSGCVNDARDIDGLVKHIATGQILLLNADATRDNIIDAVKRTLSYAKADDWAILHWSGHGSWIPDLNGDEPDGRDEVIVPYDYRNVISDDVIYDLIMDRNQNSKVVALFDSCHSGSVYRLFNDPDGSNFATVPKSRFMDPDRIIEGSHEQRELGNVFARRLRGAKDPQIGPGVIHIAGCADTEYSYDAKFRGRPNGAFTYCLLEACKKMRAGSNFNTLFSHIRQMLPSRSYPQTPRLNARAVESRWDVPWLVQ